MSLEHFDWEFLGFCGHTLIETGGNKKCNKPAIAQVWWADESDKIEREMPVCQRHLDYLKFREWKNRVKRHTESIRTTKELKC